MTCVNAGSLSPAGVAEVDPVTSEAPVGLAPLGCDGSNGAGCTSVGISLRGSTGPVLNAMLRGGSEVFMGSVAPVSPEV